MDYMCCRVGGKKKEMGWGTEFIYTGMPLGELLLEK